MINKCLKMSVFIMLMAFSAEAVESNSIGVFTDPECSVLYRTLSSNILTLPADIAAYEADSAELSITGIDYSKTFVCEGESNFTVSLPSVSETSENVYRLILTYSKDGVVKAVRTATLGHVASCGKDLAVTRVRNPESVRWNLSGCRIVLPVPYGAESLSIDGCTHALDGYAGWFGWRCARSADPMQLCLATFDGNINVAVTSSLISGLILSLR